ncbi:MAG: glycosyltransferase family 2 protein [Candidatus Polarisedimenticolia bacterium]
MASNVAPAPRVSVIIPAYNRADLLPATLESVFAQGWREFEIVVVDDGSTDGTAALLASYGDRIRWVAQQNRGVAAARNRGIREARGAFLAFLDSDDLWEPDALGKIMQAFEDHPDAGLVAIMAREITAAGERTGIVYGKRTPGPFFSTAGLLWGDQGGCSWFVVRRDVLERVGLYDESLRSAEECDLCLRLSFVTRMVVVREPLLLRRAHPGNLSRNRLTNARHWIRILEKLRRDHPEFVRAHPRAYRRTLGKELLRLGRGLLASGAGGASHAEARSALARSIRTFPFFPRAWLYLVWALLAPTTFRRWRGADGTP